ATSHHEQYALEDDFANRLSEFLPRNIQDFLTDLVLGNSADVPPVPSGSRLPAAPAVVPVTPVQRPSPPAPDRRAQLPWVRQDMATYIEASKTGFASYKKGTAQLSQGYQMWDSLVKPASAKGCWVVQGATATTLSCLLLEQADLNELRSYYAELNKTITAMLP